MFSYKNGEFHPHQLCNIRQSLSVKLMSVQTLSRMTSDSSKSVYSSFSEYAIGKSLAPTTTLCKRFEGELSMSFVPEAWNCGKNSLSEIGGLRDNASALELILPEYLVSASFKVLDA
ncbi:uncharacterized protein LOC143373959 isoform X1 [Andrena cerasifolii]|uniref:uncharacterized protein LOC143373959 isoform X1 n=1 Tax=Andrena cerasifolii TaxID=2819439 RepID=UPI004037692F